MPEYSLVRTWRVRGTVRGSTYLRLFQDEKEAARHKNKWQGSTMDRLPRPVFDSAIDDCPDCTVGRLMGCADEGVEYGSEDGGKKWYELVDLLCTECLVVVPRGKVRHAKVLARLPGVTRMQMYRAQVQAGAYGMTLMTTGGLHLLLKPWGLAPVVPEAGLGNGSTVRCPAR